ncbi:flavin reductase family protein [Pinisolibacter sp.]|uniref:flavin reductase family protein n=1 Tax=Pinisolibacter sp. TaxID=2172024 RepID=UPI002FDED4A5
MTTPVPRDGFPPPSARFEDIPLGEVYRLIEPGPVVLLTTTRGHLANVMTLSWHMMVDFSPPLIACVVAGCLSSEAMDETGECVVAIPAVEIARAVVAIGNASGRRIDKFAEYGLTPLGAEKVGAPLVAECFVNLECRVVDATLAETYGLRILEVVKAWRDPAKHDARTIHHHGFGDFVVDGRKLHLPSKMP